MTIYLTYPEKLLLEKYITFPLTQVKLCKLTG